MTQLYSYRGAIPGPLPHRVRLSDGFTRTNPETFTPEELSEWGYIGPIEVPEFDEKTQSLDWDFKNQEYVINDLTESQINNKHNEKANWISFWDGLLTNEAFIKAQDLASQSIEINLAYTNCSTQLLLARSGNLNLSALQSCFDNLLSLISLTEEEERSLTGLAVSSYIDKLLVFNFNHA